MIDISYHLGFLFILIMLEIRDLQAVNAMAFLECLLLLIVARLGTAEDHRLGTHVKHPALRIAREAAVEVLVARMLSMLPHLAERAQG